MHNPKTLDFARIAQDLQIRKVQVESVVQLLDEGNTIPFITRYRKERTGGLNEDVLRRIQARVQQLRQLADRKQTILKSIEGQGKLTDSLRDSILAADSSKRLEDLYLPYKPKKRTLATAAREKGLEPLALAIWNNDPAAANLTEVLPGMVNAEKELPTPEAVLEGVKHILAELVADTADVRAAVRAVFWDTGRLCTAKTEGLPDGQGLDYKDYFQFTEPVRQVPPHRILAINRGEKEKALKVRLEWEGEIVRRLLFEGIHDRPPVLPLKEHPHAEFLKTVVEDALARLLVPSLENEVRRELTDRAQEHAVT
ncbi:MAG TPA: Tex-like N-terminal domain-containing protein, partial [Isosphaeraceae bacterium]|nr:Tex-like N-terminal domain-containing protein [Isosphaeraceae bacterium]